MVQPGTGEVLAHLAARPMGRERKKGADLPQLRRGQQVRRLRRLPGRVDLQDLRARRRARAGAADLDEASTPRRRCTSRRTTSWTATAPTRCTRPGTRHNSTSNGTFDMYKGTRLSVNTYFAQLERKTGLCEPYALAKAMGVDLTDPDARAGAVVHPRRRQRQPAGDGRRLRDRRRPRQALRRPAGHPDPEQRRQGLQELPEAVPAGDAAVHRRHDQRHPQGRDAPGGFGQALALDKPSAGKTGTINRQHGRLVRRLHAGTWRPPR